MPATVAALAVSFSVLRPLFLHGREHFGVDQGRNRDSDPLLLLPAIDGAIASGLLRLAAHRPEAGLSRSITPTSERRRAPVGRVAQEIANGTSIPEIQARGCSLPSLA
jgi:hypothetical protein